VTTLTTGLLVALSAVALVAVALAITLVATRRALVSARRCVRSLSVRLVERRAEVDLYRSAALRLAVRHGHLSQHIAAVEPRPLAEADITAAVDGFDGLLDAILRTDPGATS
jgi:hypothetical protein